MAAEVFHLNRRFVLDGHEFAIKGNAAFGEQLSQFTVGWHINHPRLTVEGDFEFNSTVDHSSTRIVRTSVVLVLFNVGPCSRQVDVAAERHHQADVAAVGHRSVKQANGNATTVWTGVVLADNHDPFAGLDACGPLKGGIVH